MFRLVRYTSKRALHVAIVLIMMLTLVLPLAACGNPDTGLIVTTPAPPASAARTSLAAGPDFQSVDLWDDNMGLVTEFSLIKPNTDPAAAVGFTNKFANLTQVGVLCSSSAGTGSVTMYLYAWNTDYDTTLAAQYLAKYTFEDYDDGSWNIFDLTGMDLGAGDYLLVVTDGFDPNGADVGVLVSPNSVDNATYYENGVQTPGALCAYYQGYN